MAPLFLTQLVGASWVTVLHILFFMEDGFSLHFVIENFSETDIFGISLRIELFMAQDVRPYILRSSPFVSLWSLQVLTLVLLTFIHLVVRSLLERIPIENAIRLMVVPIHNLEQSLPKIVVVGLLLKRQFEHFFDETQQAVRTLGRWSNQFDGSHSLLNFADVTKDVLLREVGISCDERNVVWPVEKIDQEVTECYQVISSARSFEVHLIGRRKNYVSTEEWKVVVAQMSAIPVFIFFCKAEVNQVQHTATSLWLAMFGWN